MDPEVYCHGWKEFFSSINFQATLSFKKVAISKIKTQDEVRAQACELELRPVVYIDTLIY